MLALLDVGVSTPNGSARLLRTPSSRAAWSSPSALLWLHRCSGWPSCIRSGSSSMGLAKPARARCYSLPASVGGYGREQDLPNFRATDPAFGEIPAAFNDSLLPMNELGLLKGSANEKYYRLRDFTYGFAEGRGTTYSKLAPIEQGSFASKWLSISLATGEETSNEIARDARETRMGGESVRWIDLAATRNGVAHIFDRIPKNVPEAERAQWAQQRCAKISRRLPA